MKKSTLMDYKTDVTVLLTLSIFGIIILIDTSIRSTSYAYSTTDDYNHYLFAISSKHDLKFLFDGWGKFLFTSSLLLYHLITGQSLQGARYLNCLFHLVTVLLAYTLFRQWSLDRFAGFSAAFLVLLAPQNLKLSQSILTEPLFTFIVLLIFLTYTNEHYKLTFILAGFSVLARSEGILLISILLLMHFWRFGARMALKDGLWVIIPLGITSMITTLLFGLPLLAFMPANYSIFQIYGHGEPLHYVFGLRKVIGIFTLLLAVVGIILFFSKIKNANSIIISFCSFGIILVVFHDIIWILGLFGSWGTLRHLAPATPVFAFFAGYCLQQLWSYFMIQNWDLGYQYSIRMICVFFIVLCTSLWIIWYESAYVEPGVEVEVSNEAVLWIKTNRFDAIENSQELFIYNPIILALLELSYIDVPNEGGAIINQETLEKRLHSDGIVIWDSHHGPLEGKTPLSYFDEGFTLLFNQSKQINQHSDSTQEFSIYIFQRL